MIYIIVPEGSSAASLHDCPITDQGAVQAVLTRMFGRKLPGKN